MTMDGLAAVVDTNVASYIARRQSPLADYYEQRLEGRRVFMSFQTVQELWFGAYRDNWGNRRKADLAEAIRHYEIVWPTMSLAYLSAQLRSERQRAGRRLEVADAWIAATALSLQCPLASHDGDFDDIPGLELIRAPSP